MNGGTGHNMAIAGPPALPCATTSKAPCRAFVSDDAGAGTGQQQLFLPDVVVGCQPSELADTKALALTQPTADCRSAVPGTAELGRGRQPFLPTTACSTACKSTC